MFQSVITGISTQCLLFSKSIIKDYRRAGLRIHPLWSQHLDLTAKTRCGPVSVGNPTTGDDGDDVGFIFDCYGHNKLKMGVGIRAVLLLFVGMLFQLDDLRARGAKQAQQHLADDDVPLRRL